MEDGVEIVKNDNTIIDLSEEKQRRQAMLETVRLTKKNKFVDSGTDCLEDKEFDKNQKPLSWKIFHDSGFW